jgi:hypothetical protein
MKRTSGSPTAPYASLAGLVLLLAVGSAARAANDEVCVSNDSQFASALADTSYWPPQTIKVVQGTYHLGPTKWGGAAFFVVIGGTKLLGGYAAGCADAGRDIALGNTVLMDDASIIMHGNLTFEGLTWKSGIYIMANNIGDGDYGPIPGNVDLTPGKEVLFRRDAFLDGGSFVIDWGQDDDAGGVLRVVDSVARGSDCPWDFSIIAGGAPDIQLVNNTAVGNTIAVCVETRYAGGWGSGHPSISAFNNIFYGNSLEDLYFQVNTSAVLVNNVIGTHDYNGAVTQFGTLTGDPKLDANLRPIEGPPSPVINSGSNVAPGGLPEHDLDGGARVIGTTVDRGAYESGISDALIKVVTNTSDHDTGSLRSAILSVNQTGSGLITFDIPGGCGPQVITLNSELPAVQDGTIINAFTQAGASPNSLDVGDDATLCVILESGNSNVTHGIRVAGDAGDAVAVSIKGFGFSGFSDAAIDLQGGSGHFVAGNHFGGSIGGHALQPNGVDIRLGNFAHDAIIGGDDVGDRNIIGDATGSGILLQGTASPPLLFGTHDNQVLNNYVGVGWNANLFSYTDRGNGTRGIHLFGHDNTLSGNLIGFNAQAGILVDGGGAAGNIIDGNSIGVDANDSNYTNLGNDNAGIHFAGDIGDAPSGNTVRDNTIWYNGNQGVLVSIGHGNKIRKNSIYLNGLLGIDLAAIGVTANDDDGGIQQNDYANRGQNFPVVTSAGGGYASGHVSGTLTTTGGDHVVDVYVSPDCDASGHGEALVWLKGKTVTVTVPQGLDQGTAPFDIAVAIQPPSGLGNGWSIIATATDAAGDTSEFSACTAYANDTIFANGFQQPGQ